MQSHFHNSFLEEYVTLLLVVVLNYIRGLSGKNVKQDVQPADTPTTFCVVNFNSHLIIIIQTN